MISLRDKLTLDASKRTKDARGFLHAPATFARTGIQLYTAAELDAPSDRFKASDVVRVWRPAEEVFAADVLAAFRGLPVTDEHPDEDVTPTNFARLAKGFVPGAATQDGETAVGEIVVSDHDTIRKVENDKAELSVGYGCDIEWVSGSGPAGAYDGIMRAIRPNHLAIVSAGRCGPTCRIADHAPGCECGGAGCECKGTQDMGDTPKLSRIIVDGLGSFEVNDEARTVIDRLTADLKAANEKASAADGAAAAKDAAHAEAIAAKDAEIETLKAAQATDADLDKRVADRAKLIEDAKRLGGADFVTDGKDSATIRKEAVTKKLGDAAVAGRDDAYFGAAFDALVAAQPAADGSGQATTTAQDGKTDPVRDALNPANAADAAAKDSYESRMADKWKPKKVA